MELASLYNVSICASITDLQCKDDELEASYGESVTDEECPAVCEYTLFTSNINSGVYPSTSYGNLLSTQTGALAKFSRKSGPGQRPQSSPVNYKDSFLSVRIYHENAWYTHVSTNLDITVPSLIALTGK